MKSNPLKIFLLATLTVSLFACRKQVAVVKPVPAAPAPTQPNAAPPPKPAPAVTVRAVSNTPAPAVPNSETKARIQDLLNRIQDVYFDYNKHAIRPDAEVALQEDAKTLREILAQYPTYKLTIQGFCDERGSDEYNLALGDSRARQARDFLETLGLPSSQLRTVSFGKEKPVCEEHSESCWQRNRRAHITQDQQGTS